MLYSLQKLNGPIRFGGGHSLVVRIAPFNSATDKIIPSENPCNGT